MTSSSRPPCAAQRALCAFSPAALSIYVESYKKEEGLSHLVASFFSALPLLVRIPLEAFALLARAFLFQNRLHSLRKLRSQTHDGIKVPSGTQEDTQQDGSPVMQSLFLTIIFFGKKRKAL